MTEQEAQRALAEAEVQVAWAEQAGCGRTAAKVQYADAAWAVYQARNAALR